MNPPGSGFAALRPSAGEATIAALVCISAAIQWNDGAIATGALGLVTAGLFLCIWGFTSKDRRLRWMVPWAALVYEILTLLNSQPPVGAADRTAFQAIIWLASASAIAAGGPLRLPWRRLAMVAAIAGVFLCGVLMLRSTPRPKVDVWDLHQEGAKALFSGTDPYAIRVRDMYPPEYSRLFYGPGMSLGGYLTVGFPYPPISLYISSLGYLVAGDTRYAHLAAICLAALLLGFSGRGRISTLGALLLLFCPRVFFVVDANWTEPVVVFLFALTVFCLRRYPRAAPWITGLLLTGKQYMIFTAPAMLRRWRDVPKAMLAATLVTAPLVLWNVREFFNSAVFFHFAQPSRPDALSYMAWLLRYGIHMPGWVPFLLTGIAMAYVLLRAPSTPTAICSATSLVLIVFFVFNKSAFCNYYYLVVGALGAAVATLDAGDAAVSDPSTADESHPTPLP